MLISSGLQMRRYSLLLGQKILRLTASMRQLQQKETDTRSTPAPYTHNIHTVCDGFSRRVKAGCYWSHLCESGHQGERRILQRSVAVAGTKMRSVTTGLPSVKCPGISLSFNKTVHPHTEHETLFSFFNEILQNSSHQICGHPTAQIWILLTIQSGVRCSKGWPNKN